MLLHKKDDGTVFSLSKGINKAKAWESVTRTNTQVIEFSTLKSRLTTQPLVQLVLTQNLIQIQPKIKQDRVQCKIQEIHPVVIVVLQCHIQGTVAQLPNLVFCVATVMDLIILLMCAKARNLKKLNMTTKSK